MKVYYSLDCDYDIDFLEKNEKTQEMEELKDLLLTFKEKPPEFVFNDIIERSPIPGLQIEGIESLTSFPICSEQAKKITNIAHKSFPSKDEPRLNSWTLQPNQFTLQNSKYHEVLDDVLSKVAEELDYKLENVQVKINKLMLHSDNDDGFVLESKDKTDKTCFATLLMQLPSVFKGHEVIVYSEGKAPKKIRFDISESKYEIIYTAFFNSCQRKMASLKEGYRMVLVYDLLWIGDCQPPNDQMFQQSIQKASLLLEKIDEGILWTLDGKYDNVSLSEQLAQNYGEDILNGKDHQVISCLARANELLIDEKKYEFHLLEIQRDLDEEGSFRGEGESRTFRGNMDYTEDHIKIFSSRELSTGEMKYDFKNLLIQPEYHLLDFEKKFNGSLNEFWGQCDDEKINEGEREHTESFYGDMYWDPYRCDMRERKHYQTYREKYTKRVRKYSKYLLFAFPKSQKAHILSKCGIKESFKFLVEEYEAGSSMFKEYSNTFLEEVPIEEFFESCETLEEVIDERLNVTMVMQFLLKVGDVELTKSFIDKVMGAEKYSGKYYGIEEEEMIKPLINLLKAFPWQPLSESVETVISHCPKEQYEFWLDVFSSTGITEIAHKVLAISLQKMMDDKRFLPLWLKIFKLVFENEEFDNRWWDEIISCEDLVNKEYDIISHICLSLPIETNPVKFLSLLTALVTSMTTEDNPCCVKRYAENFLDVIAKIKGSKIFESALTNLSNQLVSVGHISTLIKLTELCAPKDQHSRHNEELVKLFLEGCFDSLSKATFERKHIES